MLSRRAVISGVVGAGSMTLSGCLDGSVMSDPPNEISMEMGVVEVYSGPEDSPVRLQTTLQSSLLSSTELPRLEFELYNDGDDPVSFTHLDSLLFAPGESDPSGLVILTDEEATLIEDEESDFVEQTDNRCIALEEVPNRDLDETWTVIEPDSTLSQDIAISPTQEAIANDCVEPTQYMLRSPFQFYFDADESTEDSDITLDLGFTVSFDSTGD